MNTLKEFLTYIENKRVICFGTGLMAEEAIGYPQIRDRIAFFCDNDKGKHNKKLRIGKGVYDVLAPDEMPAHYDSNCVILITSGHFKEIREQIKSILLDVEPDVYDFPVLKVMLDPKSQEFFEERILKECLKEYEIVLDQYQISGTERDKLLAEKESYIKGRSEEDRPFVVPRTMIMPTTRCNLRCKGCSSLLPLINNPQDVDINRILKDCDGFFSVVDECIRLTIGGEPFLYPELGKILERLINEPKLLGIMLITNGIKLPDESLVPLLRDKKVLLEISDYGRLESMSKAVSFMENQGLNFKVLTDQKWTDMGGIERRGRSKEELRFVYLNCDQGRVIKGMHNGRFHTCARSARMLSMGAYTSDRDWIDFTEGASLEELRARMKELYYSDYADACDYCDLGALPTKVIEAGIQINEKIKKSEYTIVKRDEYEQILKLAQMTE